MTTTAPLGRRERAKAARRAAIIAAARALLGEVGYDAMTMAAVAGRADVGVGTVFEYASTKAELLMLATAERWAHTTETLVAESRDLEPQAAVRHLLTPFVQASLLDSATAVAIARELLFGADGPHRGEVMRMVEEVEGAIAERIDASPAAAASAARLIVSGAIVELNRTMQGSGEGSVDERLERLISTVLRGASTGDR